MSVKDKYEIASFPFLCAQRSLKNEDVTFTKGLMAVKKKKFVHKGKATVLYGLFCPCDILDVRSGNYALVRSFFFPSKISKEIGVKKNTIQRVYVLYFIHFSKVKKRQKAKKKRRAERRIFVVFWRRLFLTVE